MLIWLGERRRVWIGRAWIVVSYRRSHQISWFPLSSRGNAISLQEKTSRCSRISKFTIDCTRRRRRGVRGRASCWGWIRQWRWASTRRRLFKGPCWRVMPRRGRIPFWLKVCLILLMSRFVNKWMEWTIWMISQACLPILVWLNKISRLIYLHQTYLIMHKTSAKIKIKRLPGVLGGDRGRVQSRQITSQIFRWHWILEIRMVEIRVGHLRYSLRAARGR